MHKSSMEETDRLLHRKTYETPGDGENGRPTKTREQTGISTRTSRSQMHLNMSMDTKEVVLASQLLHMYFVPFSPTNGSVFLIAFIFRKSRDKSFGFHDDCFAS